jgi:hypothetical protein
VGVMVDPGRLPRQGDRQHPRIVLKPTESARGQPWSVPRPRSPTASSGSPCRPPIPTSPPTCR